MKKLFLFVVVLLLMVIFSPVTVYATGCQFNTKACEALDDLLCDDDTMPFSCQSTGVGLVSGDLVITGSVTAGSFIGIAADKIFEGNSSVDVIDLGTGSVVWTVDGSVLWTLTAASGLVSTKGASLGDAVTISKTAANTEFPALRLENSDEPASGETGQTVTIYGHVQGTDDSGATYSRQDLGLITFGKLSDYFTAGGFADFDSYLDFKAVTDGFTVEPGQLRITGTEVRSAVNLRSTVGIYAEGAAGFVSGYDKTSPAANTAGKLTLWSAGDNNYSTVISAGTQTAYAPYVLPLAPPTVDGQALTSTIAGQWSWATVAETDTFDTVTGRGATTTNDITVGNVFTSTFDAGAYYTITQADGAGVTFDSTSDGTAGFAFSDPVNVTGDFAATGSVQSGASTIPKIVFKDSDCTDSDENAVIYANATDTGTGAEDIDLYIQQQIAGTLTTRMQFDADGDIEVTGNIDATGDVSGATIGGITEANLVDKSAAETITGTWEWGRYTTYTFGNDTANVAPFLRFNRARDADPTLDVSNGDWLGDIRFWGYGSGTYQAGAYIAAVVDGTPGATATDMPTSLIFQTSPDASATPVTRLTIGADGSSTFTGSISATGTSSISTASGGYMAAGSMVIHSSRGIYQTSQTNNQIYPVNGGTITYLSGQANSGSNIAHTMNTSASFTGSTKLLSLQNSTAEKFAVMNNGAVINSKQTLTIADSGDGNPATATWEPTASYTEATCEDTDGCTVTVLEATSVEGQIAELVNVSVNTINLANQANVLVISGAAWAGGQYDVIGFRHTGDLWFERYRSDN